MWKLGKLEEEEERSVKRRTAQNFINKQNEGMNIDR